jgi:hypothetical protein
MAPTRHCHGNGLGNAYGSFWRIPCISSRPKTDASIAVLDVPDFVMDALVEQRDREKLLRHYKDDGLTLAHLGEGDLEEPVN